MQSQSQVDRIVTRLGTLLGLLTLAQARPEDSDQAFLNLLQERRAEFDSLLPQTASELLSLAQKEREERERPEPDSKEYQLTPQDKQQERQRRKESKYQHELLKKEGMDRAKRYEKSKRERLLDAEDPWPVSQLKASPEYQDMTPYQRQMEEEKVRRDILRGKYPEHPPKELMPTTLLDQEERDAKREQQRKEQSKHLTERFMRPEAGEAEQPPGGDASPAPKKKKRPNKNKNPRKRKRKEPEDELSEADPSPIEEAEELSGRGAATPSDSEQLLEDSSGAEEPRARPENHENTLCPSCVPEHDEQEEQEGDDEETNPYKRALKDNEKRKEAFIDELKAAADARKKQEAEAKARAEEEAAFKKEALEREYEETGVMPQELADILAEEEAKAAEEEAKKRPEPPTAATMKDRVNDERERRKKAHMDKMREEAEEEKRQKQAARDAETERRRKEDPNYEPPPPLTVPKGPPKPPPGYQLPKKAEEFFNPKKREPDKEEKEEKEPKQEELKEPVQPMLQHPPPAPEKPKAEEAKKPQKEGRRKKPKKEHRPAPETSRAAHSDYSFSSDSIGGWSMYNLPIESDYSYSDSPDGRGYKYNVPKSTGPKPETKRPSDYKRSKRGRKRDHARQKEHMAEFEEAERQQKDRQRHREQREKQAEKERQAQKQAERERREKERQEKEKAELLAQQLEEERIERERKEQERQEQERARRLAQQQEEERLERERKEQERLAEERRIQEQQERERRDRLRREQEKEEQLAKEREQALYEQELVQRPDPQRLEEQMEQEPKYPDRHRGGKQDKEVDERRRAMEAYEKGRQSDRERPTLEHDRFDHKTRREKGHKPTKKQHSKWADEDEDYYSLQRDQGRQRGQRKKPEARKRYMEDLIEDVHDPWGRPEVQPWYTDVDSFAQYFQEARSDEFESFQQQQEPARKHKADSEKKQDHQADDKQRQPKARQLDEWAQPQPSSKSRPEPLDPWKISEPATLPWPGDEGEEERASQKPLDPALLEFQRPAGRRHHREQPRHQTQDPDGGWESDLQAQAYSELSDQAPKKKRPKGSKRSHRGDLYEEPRQLALPEDELGSALEPRPESSRHKWYLPEEKLHGQTGRKPLQDLDDAQLLEGLWYLPQSEQRLLEAKPTAPKRQDSKGAEKDGPQKKQTRHDRETTLPLSVKEHETSPWYLPGRQQQTPQHQTHRDLDQPVMDKHTHWFEPAPSGRPERQPGDFDLLQAFEKREQQEGVDYSTAWFEQPVDSPPSHRRAYGDFAPSQHQQAQPRDQAPGHADRPRPQHRHGPVRHGPDRQYPMSFAIQPAQPQMPQQKRAHDYARYERRYHGHLPRNRQQRQFEEEYENHSANAYVEGAGLPDSQPLHLQEHQKSRPSGHHESEKQLHPYFSVREPPHHEKNRYQRANLPFQFQPGDGQGQEAEVVDKGTMLEWLEEIHKERNSLESAEQPGTQAPGETSRSNGIDFTVRNRQREDTGLSGGLGAHEPPQPQSLPESSSHPSNGHWETSIPAMTLQQDGAYPGQSWLDQNHGLPQHYMWHQPHGPTRGGQSHASPPVHRPSEPIPYHYAMTFDPHFKASNGNTLLSEVRDYNYLQVDNPEHLNLTPREMASRFESKDWNASAYDETMIQRTLEARQFKLKHESGPSGRQAEGQGRSGQPQPRRAAPKNAQNEAVPNKPKPGEEIDHQRLLRDEYAKRMQKQREKESERPPAKQPPKKIPQLPKAKPDRDGKGDKPQDFKSMTEYARHVMEKKQREMEQEEKRKLAEDPDYVPKKPLSPTMPKNMPKKEDDKSPQPDKAHPSAKTLFDQIQEQKEKRERQKIEEDPNYKPKTLPKKQQKDDRKDPDDAGTLYEQATKFRRLREKQLLEEDESKSAQDPAFKRRFAAVPEAEEDEFEEFLPYSQPLPVPRRFEPDSIPRREPEPAPRYEPAQRRDAVPRREPAPRPKQEPESSEGSLSTLSSPSSESSESSVSSDSESSDSSGPLSLASAEWEEFASPYADPYDFWNFDLPRPTRANEREAKWNHRKPAPTSSRRGRRPDKHRRKMNETLPAAREPDANPMEEYVDLEQNQIAADYALYPNQGAEYGYADPMGGNYFDSFDYDQMGYGWQSYTPFQASTQASPYEKRVFEQQGSPFEIDWDFGQTRGMYDFDIQADGSSAEEYGLEDLPAADEVEEGQEEELGQPDEEVLEDIEEADQEPAPVPEMPPEVKKEPKASDSKKPAEKGKAAAKAKAPSKKKEPTVTRIPRKKGGNKKGGKKKGKGHGKKKNDESENEASDSDDYSSSEAESSSADYSSSYSESDSGSDSQYKKKRHAPRPFYHNDPLGNTPENSSPQELEQHALERRTDAGQSLPLTPRLGNEQWQPSPLLSLAADVLTDLKQDTNKGEDPNLHIIHEFEPEEIERAKEYEQRAQLWDQQHALEQEMEMNQALAEAGGQDVDDLLLEVNKVLHTRFKNMYEGEMLLPNLGYNPDYEAPF